MAVAREELFGESDIFSSDLAQPEKATNRRGQTGRDIHEPARKITTDRLHRLRKGVDIQPTIRTGRSALR
ncbi:hypothetical protein GCM10027180_34290 [Microbulbifer echini]